MRVRFSLSTLLVIFLTIQVSAGSPAWAQNAAHRVAVVPFKSTFNPDYGVFMADRIAYEFFQHAHMPALGRNRFVLVETDTLTHQVQDEINHSKQRIGSKLHEHLRQEIPANYLLTGTITSTGIHHLKVNFIDLTTGEIVWSNTVRDNPSWVWTHNRDVGETPVEEIRKDLGFGIGETPPPPLSAEDLPKQVLMQPFFTTSYQALSLECESRLRNTMTQDAIFTLVPGTLKGPRGIQRFSRLSSNLLSQASGTTLADAVLCGSLLTFGKDGGADNIAIVTRLIDVQTGLILWMDASNGRRVWRHDKMADIISGVMASLTENLAQFGANAAESVMEDLRAQAKDGAGWALLGEAYLSRGLLRQAEEAFNTALTFTNGHARAHTGLGQITLRRGGDFKKAVDAFREAILIDPNYLYAYCYLAQAYLDRDMTDGEDYVLEALKRDPSFSLGWRILGDWFLSLEDDRQARDAYNKYLALEPDDTEVAVRLGRVLLRLNDFAQIDRLIAPIQRAKPEASDLVPVVAIKNLRVKRYEESTRLFNRFLSQIDARERSLYEDIRPVISDNEQSAYAALPDAEQKVFRERFWREKDPDLSSAFNERQLTHYERVWVARQDYGQEVYPWDQRGAVFVRYGQPDYRTRSGWTPILPPARVQEVKERMYRELYTYPPEGELIGPVFPIRSDRGISISQENELAVQDEGIQDNSFNAGLDRQTVEGQYTNNTSLESYAPVTLQNDNSIVPWESWVYLDVNGGMVFDFTKEMGGVSGYDFAPIPPIPPTMLKSTIRVAEYAPTIAFQRAVSTKPDNFRQPIVLPIERFFYDVSDFRGGTQKTRVDVSYLIPLSQLTVVTDGQNPQVVVERALALADSTYTVVYRQDKRIQMPADTSLASGQAILDVMRQDVPAGQYHMTMTVTDVMSGRVGKLTRELTVEPYGHDKLLLSDLMLVKSFSDTLRDIRFRRGSWEVKPNPERSYVDKQDLAFYCELYNLMKNEFGQTNYKVTTAVKAIDEKASMRSFGAVVQPEVSLSYEQVGDQVWERLRLEVDLSNAQPGPNRLVLVIEDLVAGTRVAKETTFEYILQE